MFPTTILGEVVGKVTVPPAPPAPKMALSPLALVQAMLVKPFHQLAVLVSQLPEPSCAPAVTLFVSQVKVAAGATGTNASWTSKARATRMNRFGVCRQTKVENRPILPRIRAICFIYVMCLGIVWII